MTMALRYMKTAEAIRFNESLRIPVKWKQAKTVSGVSKRTGAPIQGKVGHVLLLEDWGVREKGEFLCGARIRNPLAHRLFNLNERDVEASKYQRVTCQKCLAAAKRMNKNGAVSTPRSNTKSKERA
jgi:hypothetical protein